MIEEIAWKSDRLGRYSGSCARAIPPPRGGVALDEFQKRCNACLGRGRSSGAAVAVGDSAGGLVAALLQADENVLCGNPSQPARACLLRGDPCAGRLRVRCRRMPVEQLPTGVPRVARCDLRRRQTVERREAYRFGTERCLRSENERLVPPRAGRKEFDRLAKSGNAAGILGETAASGHPPRGRKRRSGKSGPAKPRCLTRKGGCKMDRRPERSPSKLNQIGNRLKRVGLRMSALAGRAGFGYHSRVSIAVVARFSVSNNAPLVAIVFADLENYSALMTRDEGDTIAFVDRCLERARRATLRFGGVFVKAMGDGWISFFPSASGAVECARLFLRLTARRERDAPSGFRIAVHLGEVRFARGEAYGHAINVAARMQSIAQPGGVVVSQPVMQQVGSPRGFRFEALGHPNLRNIGDGLLLYRLVEGASAEAEGTRIRLGVIGGLAAHDDRGAAIPVGSALQAAFLGLLALYGQERVPQDRVAVMLWPDRNARAARDALARLRRQIAEKLGGGPSPVILSDGGVLALNRSRVEVDLDQIVSAIEAGEIDPALRLGNDVTDGILAGLDGTSALFGTWLAVRRAIWRERIVGALETCLERADPAQPLARLAAETLLRFEPGHEPASLALMRHFAERGWTEAALREHGRITRHLENAYGAAPGPKIAAMAAALRSGDVRGDSSARRTPTGPRLLRIAIGSIAGAEGDGAAVSERFRGDLLSNLSRFRIWAVLDLPDDSFGTADYALVGRCQPLPEGVQIGFRLIEPATRRVAWTDTVTVTAAEWRAAQGSVVGRIAAALEVYISADRLARAIPAPPDGPEEYDLWLQGEALLLRWTPEAEDEAAALFRKLIERAPSFAPAWASLASIHNVRHIVHPGAPRDPEDDAAGLAYAARAVELDPMEARNHLALAWTAALGGAFTKAAVHLDLATSLNPYSPNTTISAAMGYAFLGDPEQAVAVLDAAIARAPVLRPHQWCYAAAVRFLAGDDEGAIAAARASGDQIADNQGWLAAALARQGRTAEARKAFARLLDALAPIWEGEEPIAPEPVHRWFAEAYPIRREADRAALSAALRLSMPAPPLREVRGGRRGAGVA